MKKILLIYRGLNYRQRSNSGIEYAINSLNAIDNWKKTIYEDLKENNIQYDICFITYSSNILEELVDKINPKYLIVDGGYNNQIENFIEVKNIMLKLRDEYDRFVIFRYDYQYKYKITKWPKWDERGIIITNRDPVGGLFSDLLFVVDSSHTEYFSDAVDNITMWPHQIGKYLAENNIPFHMMYDDCYGQLNHPLYTYLTIEKDPIIE